ncbi:uncharacterized protein LOC142768256 [Rhipicephalus microplus]|uniref:uncharacterized protein LOC142768256 n=1 Tax=Rhipicephalus microplus TaxID=6941 RepID=UPI003F6B708B
MHRYEDVSAPAVRNTIHEVTEAIITVAARKSVADFLLTTAAKDEAKVEFVLRGCIPGVLACADGTLVTIRKPEGFRLADTASFMSRRGYYVLNVMIKALSHGQCPPAPLPPSPVPLPHAVLQKRCGWLIFHLPQHLR